MIICHSICDKLTPKNKNGPHYSKNEKFCKICDTFLVIFSYRCPCCGGSIRSNVRNKKDSGFFNTNNVWYTMSELVRTSLYLTKEHKDFINENAISLTKFVRNSLNAKMEQWN